MPTTLGLPDFTNAADIESLRTKLDPPRSIDAAAFPGGAADGQEFAYRVYPADVPRPGIAWKFRYDADTNNARPWEFIGGAWYEKADNADQTGFVPDLGGNWSDLGGTQMALYPPFSADYDVEFAATIRKSSGTAANISIGLRKATTGGGGVDTDAYTHYFPVGAIHTIRGRQRMTCNAGTALVLSVLSTNTDAFDIFNRSMRMQPVRAA